MSSVDGGLKYKGLSFEAEYYWRWLSDYEGSNVSGIPDINDHGYQIQASAMAVPKIVQVYVGNSRHLRPVTATRGKYRVRRQLVSGEAARFPRQHRVHQREPFAGRLHRVSDAGRRERHESSTPIWS